MFGWLFRRLSPSERLAARYGRICELFGQRFPTWTFSTCDFRGHFGGHGHNASVTVEPLQSVEATRSLAYARLAEMIECLRPLHRLFGPHDRVQFVVGFPEAVKPSNRWILKGWLPASRLQDVKSPDFVAVGGSFVENDSWFEGLWR